MLLNCLQVNCNATEATCDPEKVINVTRYCKVKINFLQGKTLYQCKRIIVAANWTVTLTI